MQNKNAVELLKQSIIELESKVKMDEQLLKAQLLITLEGISPVNLIKSTIKDLTVIPDFKDDLLNTTMSLAAGFISKKAVLGGTHNPIKRLLGTLLQLAVTNLVSKNADTIKSVVTNVSSAVVAKVNSYTK